MATTCPVHAEFDPLEVGRTLLDGGHKPQPSMVSLGPPAHGRLRKPAARAFTPCRLLEVPDRCARLVADPAVIPAAVDEILRFDPSVPVWRRVTTRPVTLGGVGLPAGAKLFLWLAAAGRDAAVFPEPDAFDPERADSRRTLAFGRGIHFCIGSALGRLEASLALAELTRRFPALRLLGQEIPFHPNISFRGPQALWVAA